MKQLPDNEQPAALWKVLDWIAAFQRGLEERDLEWIGLIIAGIIAFAMILLVVLGVTVVEYIQTLLHAAIQ